MNPELKKQLIGARDILESEIMKMTNDLKQVNILLGNFNPPKLRGSMATDTERRKGGMMQVVKALQVLGSGSIKQVAHKVQEMYPISTEINILSKVATYLKRLSNDGTVTYIHGPDSYKTKIYTINDRNDNL